jgi:acetyl/propionyl-CoA carboxylase alpha subunit
MSPRPLVASIGTDRFTAQLRDHVVTVARAGDERTAQISTHYLGHGRVFLVEGDRRWLAWVVEDGDRRWVFCDGTVTLVERHRETARARRSAAAGHDTLTAPMPATVVRILATAGTRVERGAVVLLLEAMKMELPVRAPHDAVVTAIHCREGELVQPDATLVELA